jgi:hypothetical protein
MNDDLSPEVQDLIDRGRLDAPSNEERASMKRAVLGRIAIGTLTVSSTVAASASMPSAGAGAAGVGAAVTSLAGSKFGSVAGLVLSVVLGGSTAAGVIVWREHDRTHGSAASLAPSTQDRTKTARTGEAASRADAEERTEPEPVTVVPPSMPAEVNPAPPVTSLVPHAVSAPGPRRKQVPSTLEAELPLLEEAQEALRAGDAASALARLNEQARRFPNGELTEEREAAHAIAACRLDGDRGEDDRGGGRAEVEAFVRTHPASPLADRVRQACERHP